MSRMHGIPPRQYACRGGMITAKEAADHFGISIKTIYNRLQKCGDNMDAVWNYYENHSRGGKRPMKKSISDEEYNNVSEKQKQQRAVDEIAEILCGGNDDRRIPKEAMNAAPAGYKAEDAGDLREETGPEQVRVIKVNSGDGTLQPLEQEKASDERTESEIVDTPEYIERDACEDESGSVRIYFPGMMIEEDRQRKINCRSLAMHNNAIDALDALIEDGIDDDIAAEKAEELLDRLRQVRMNTFEHMVPWAKIAREYK